MSPVYDDPETSVAVTEIPARTSVAFAFVTTPVVGLSVAGDTSPENVSPAGSPLGGAQIRSLSASYLKRET